MLDAYRALYTEWQAMIKHAANLFTKTVTQGADNHALRQENERLRRGLYADYKQGKRLLDEAIHDGTRTADALNERIYNMLAAEKQRIGELEWKIKGYEHDRIALVYEIDRLRKELRTLTTKE
jgi:DNA anti-recombination protein RmuC